MKFNAIKGLIGAFASLKTLLLTFLLAGCSSLPEKPKTIAGGAPGQIDYCVTIVGANLFCINAKRTMDSE